MIKSIKVLLPFTLSFTLGLGLIGCGSATSSTQEPTSASTEDTSSEHTMDHSAEADPTTGQSATGDSDISATTEAGAASATITPTLANSDTANPNVEIPADLNTATTQLSAQKLYSVSIFSNLEPITVNQPHSWVLSLESAEGQPVENAGIAVDFRLPQQNQGMPSQPRVTQDLGEGNYLVEGINFPVAGWWEANFSISAAGQSDQVTFNLVLAELDTAATKLSEQGLYRVSIDSQLDPIPINQIHNWTLHVETAEGQPVENAEITLSGDMLQHKHGLPTEPRVTQALGNGNYLVEGMKFQMTGWWTVNFTITAKSQSDLVTFNLILEN